MDQNLLLKALLKSKIDEKKSLSSFIEDLLKRQSADFSAQLKEKLSNLLIFFSQNEAAGDEILKNLLDEKISAIDVDSIPTKIEEIYQKLSSNTPNLDVKFSFDAKDLQAITMMRNNFYWVRSEFNQNIQTRLKNVMEDVFLGKIPRAQMAAKLRAEFGSELDKDVKYFAGVGDHIISQSQNIARVNQATKAGAPFFRVEAIIDAHTTCICRCMHGRIIPAAHLQKQAAAIMSAKSMRAKKAAATWRDSAYLGRSDKLPSNFGLPPYHFKCRTELIPVWVDEFSLDGVKMRASRAPNDDEILRHIDKTGVERVLSKQNTHIFEKHKNITASDIVKALNSITKIAPKKEQENRSVATAQNGIFMVFDGDKIISAYRPSDKLGKNNLEKHFKNNAVAQKNRGNKMALREFDIDIYEDIDWEIRLDGLDDYESVPAFNSKAADYGFGIFKIAPDGKITYIFDINVRDDDLQTAQNDPMMQEICRFTHGEHEFIGTFIDALKYVEDNFKGK